MIRLSTDKIFYGTSTERTTNTGWVEGDAFFESDTGLKYCRLEDSWKIVSGNITTALKMSGLRGFWPMSSFDENGDAFDFSGQNRTLTYYGNPVYGWDGLVPYIKLDGTGDYLSRADEAGLDILGTETYVENPGLTIGGWFNSISKGASSTGYFTKWNTGAGADMSYALWKASGSNKLWFSVGNGATFFNVLSLADIIDGSWEFWAGRYTPSSELALFRSGAKSINTTSIPASILNGVAPLSLGAIGAGLYLSNIKASCLFLCAAALEDSIIQNFYQQTRVAYGV